MDQPMRRDGSTDRRRVSGTVTATATTMREEEEEEKGERRKEQGFCTLRTL